jgi:hypothetical protein
MPVGFPRQAPKGIGPILERHWIELRAFASYRCRRCKKTISTNGPDGMLPLMVHFATHVHMIETAIAVGA